MSNKINDKDKKDEGKTQIKEKSKKISEIKNSEKLDKPGKLEKKKDKKKDKKKQKKKSEKEILLEKIEELKKQNYLKDENYAFLQAELENTRKHFIKQIDIAKNRERFRTIAEFTPIIESFDLAIKSKEKMMEKTQNNQLEDYIKGFEAIANNLHKIFKNFGVEPIDKTDVQYDYNLHETVFKKINDDVPEDTVLYIVKRGYKMDGNVIHAAKVVVSKKPLHLPSLNLKKRKRKKRKRKKRKRKKIYWKRKIESFKKRKKK